MQLILDRILTFNLIGTTLVFYVAARLYLLLDLAMAITLATIHQAPLSMGAAYWIYRRSGCQAFW